MTNSKMRLLAEFCVPALAIGGLATLGAFVLSVVAGQPAGWAVLSSVALGVPIGLFGAGYALLVAGGKVPIGVFTPCAALWAVGFPLSRLTQEVVTVWLFTGSPGLPLGSFWGFLLYQAILSMGFAIGYLWLHEQLGRYWWPRLMDRNPYAYRSVERHMLASEAIRQREDATKEGRRQRRAAKARGSKAALRS
jgi:hypothetical protein